VDEISNKVHFNLTYPNKISNLDGATDGSYLNINVNASEFDSIYLSLKKTDY